MFQPFEVFDISPIVFLFVESSFDDILFLSFVFVVKSWKFQQSTIFNDNITRAKGFKIRIFASMNPNLLSHYLNLRLIAVDNKHRSLDSPHVDFTVFTIVNICCFNISLNHYYTVLKLLQLKNIWKLFLQKNLRLSF